MADIYDAIQAALRGGTAAPEGVTFDPRAPQGLTIADPAMQDQYLARQGAQAAGIAQQKILDDQAANQLKLLGPLLQGVHGLDPQLQGFLLGKLGFPGAPKVADKQATQLQNQLTMATYKNELGAEQRDFKNAMLAQQLAEAQRRTNEVFQQHQISNQMAQQRQSLAEARSSEPTIPFKGARESVIAAFQAGERDPAKLAAIARGMGYDYQGGVSQEGPFSMIGLSNPSFEPRLGRLQAQMAQPQAAAQASAPVGAGEVMVEKDGQKFAIAPAKLQEALKRGYKQVR